MTQTRQLSYAAHTTKLLALLVFAATALSDFKLSEAACTSRKVNLKSEIWTQELSNETAENTKNLTKNIVQALPTASGNQSCPRLDRYYKSTVPNDFPGVIADVSIDEEKVESFEDQLLGGIPYYHNSTVNKNHTMTPASRVFVVLFNVSHSNTTDNNVTEAVKTVLDILNGTVTVLENRSGYYKLRIWMNMTVDAFPSNALKDLADAVKNGFLNGIAVKSSSFMAFSLFPQPTTKKFEVTFDYNAECSSAVSNKSSNDYKELHKNISEFLTMTLTTSGNTSGYIGSSISKMQCSSSNSRSARASPPTVKVVAIVKYSKSRNPNSIGSALLACGSPNPKVSNVQVKLLNPSSLGESQGPVSVVCPTSSATTMSATPGPSKKPDTATPPTTQPPVMGKTPRLFARLRLALTWSQFCSKLEESLKESIAKNVHDKKGNRVSSDRVIFINARKNCADPSKGDEQVDLWFYIANRTGSETPSKCITLKAYRVLKMMVDNGNTNMLGSDFRGKVVGLNLAGCDAKQFDNKDKMDDWILILIIIALIVGAILLFLACCCICCGAARRRRRRRHRDKYGNVEMVVVDADGNRQANGEGGKERKQAKKHHKGGYYGGRGYGYSDSDDSDDYLCFGGRAGGGRGRGGDYDADDGRRRGKHHGGDGSGDGDLNSVDGAGKNGRRHGKERRSRGVDYDSDDSDVDQLCGGRRRKRPRKPKGRKNKNKSGDETGDGKGDGKGNNNIDVPKDDKGKENAGYDDVRSDSDKQASSQPTSYQNLAYGLGDRKPSADGGYTSLMRDGQSDNTYATVDDAAKRQSRGGSVGSHGYITLDGGGANAGGANTGGTGAGGAGAGGAGAGGVGAGGGGVGGAGAGGAGAGGAGARGVGAGGRGAGGAGARGAGAGGAGAGGAGAGGAGAGGAGAGGAGAGGAGAGGAALAGTAGLVAGSMADGNKRGSLTPAIVTSPAPDSGPQTNAGVSGSPGPRRGSGSKGGSPTGSRPSSASGLGSIDDELQRERRRSSIHSLIDDDAEPLKHKTATVGIVGLALRNKNERKKETEFKNLDKDMPALGTYPANTAGKNRNPDILPNPRSRVKLSSSPDYINASYLHDHKGQRHYIATQHPLVETKVDFWQMVWDTDSHLVVMVNDDENSKQMDYPQYWPAAEGSSMDFNGIVVSNKQVVTKPDYVITNLVVSNTKTKPSATREIYHYRYTSWKEKDVPNIAMFVGFVVATREVGRKYEDGKSPIVVHCSDGQGFTGVFVALDIGIRSHEENKTSVVDLFELAKRLRQGRNGIFDSLQLYNYTYQCLYEYTVNYDEEAEKKKEQNGSTSP